MYTHSTKFNVLVLIIELIYYRAFTVGQGWCSGEGRYVRCSDVADVCCRGRRGVGAPAGRRQEDEVVV